MALVAQPWGEIEGIILGWVGGSTDSGLGGGEVGGSGLGGGEVGGSGLGGGVGGGEVGGGSEGGWDIREQERGQGATSAACRRFHDSRGSPLREIKNPRRLRELARASTRARPCASSGLVQRGGSWYPCWGGERGAGA